MYLEVVWLWLFVVQHLCWWRCCLDNQYLPRSFNVYFFVISGSQPSFYTSCSFLWVKAVGGIEWVCREFKLSMTSLEASLSYNSFFIDLFLLSVPGVGNILVLRQIGFDPGPRWKCLSQLSKYRIFQIPDFIYYHSHLSILFIIGSLVKDQWAIPGIRKYLLKFFIRKSFLVRGKDDTGLLFIPL